MQHLSPGATLQNGNYRITKLLGHGGFGITYLAEQTRLSRQVAIKEFFIATFCERDENTSTVRAASEGSRDLVDRYRAKFIKEAQKLAQLSHANIIRVYDVFQENGTAYYVMEYASNGSLADKLKLQGRMTEAMATHYIKQVADALEYIHKRNMNHLDIKPANIMLNDRDEALLIDFGLSKQYDATTGSQTSTTPVGISEGYAPMEQYKQSGVQGFTPEADIYALGATFYALLTGKTPPSSSDVFDNGLPVHELRACGVSQKAIDTISKAMQPQRRNRFQSARAFIEMLDKGSWAPRLEKKEQPNLEKTRLIDEKSAREEKTQLVGQPAGSGYSGNGNGSNGPYKPSGDGGGNSSGSGGNSGSNNNPPSPHRSSNAIVYITCLAVIAVAAACLYKFVLSPQENVVQLPTASNNTTVTSPLDSPVATNPEPTPPEPPKPEPPKPEPTIVYPSSANCRVSGRISSYGNYSLVFDGSSSGLISPGQPGKEGYLGDVSYNPNTGYLSATAYSENYDLVGYYSGTLTQENGVYYYRGSFSNTSGKSGSFTMTGY